MHTTALRLGLGIGIALCSTAAPAFAAEPVVAQDAREPMDEARGFHLPPGFEAQLVAAEPQIHKPINIAFDDKGRLWVTDTIEYPFPAAEGKPTRDTLKLLSDFAPDGRARSITTFADNLNIPIGVLPQRTADGHDSAIVYSIPGVWRVTDTHNIGKADERKLLVTGQAHDDTHGMTGSFNEGFDGHIYAVHGFRNASTLRGTDNSSIDMTSGHTYRFNADGSHLEVHTYGQVNPFGMCFDPLGNLFTSDCETMPILLTLRGAYYSSFGRPHDGLGFGPDISDHMYGSSAIAGLVDYVAPNFPAGFQNMMLVGNVVTNRINRAQLVPRGSAFHADDAPDFLTSDDHWFRPVSMKVGPDGAIYIADFYNRIIGHYEVDLHHPGRDKERGRIWRIVYTGKDVPTAAPKPFDLTRAEPAELIQYLSDANFAVRMLAMNYIANCRPELSAQVNAAVAASNAQSELKVHGMWILKRQGALDESLLGTLAGDVNAAVRVHAMRVLAETTPWSAAQHTLAVAGLSDVDTMVQRCAADALGRHAQLENVRPLLDARAKAPAGDKHLVHTLRMALRDQLNNELVAGQLPLAGSTVTDLQALFDVASGATSAGSSMLVVRQIGTGPSDTAQLTSAFRHVGRYGSDANAEELAKTAAGNSHRSDSAQAALFMAFQDGITQRKGTLPAVARTWGAAIAKRLFVEPGEVFAGWTRLSLDGTPPEKEMWAVQDRKSADDITAPFISSLPLGETNTGIIRSKPFAIPATLTFFAAGHNGLPTGKATDGNVIRLRAADSGKILAQAFPPRNDLAKKVTWDLSKYSGRQGILEVTDGDNRTAYAWLAVGRFEPAVISVPATTDSNPLLTAINIAGVLRLSEVDAQVAAVLTNPRADTQARVAAAKALPELGGNIASHFKMMRGVLCDPTVPAAVRDAAAGALQQDTSPETREAYFEALGAAPQKLQVAFARSMATGSRGAEALLDAVAAGKASPRLLRDINVHLRLTQTHLPNIDERVAQLTANLPPADQGLQAMIDSRVKAFSAKQASPQHGQQVFQQNCATCHSVAGVGANVGPQLDGIGIRGAARLVEDILDPSRNVDAAFRYSTYKLDGGEVVDGIPRREEGDVITVADSTGKEIAIARSRIKQTISSSLSLMPGNFGEVIEQKDFNDLLSYLLSTAN